MFQKKNLKWVYLCASLALTSFYINCSKSNFGVSNASSAAGAPAAQTVTCNTNETLNASGVCVYSGCAADKEIWNGSCVAICPANQSRNSSGACESGCNPTTSEMFNGQCKLKCLSTQTRNVAGTCEENCNLAINDMVGGQCLPKCAAGQVRDGVTCKSSSCSNGAIAPNCTDCGSNKHLEGTSCTSNTRSCNPQPANTKDGYQIWSGGAWQSACLGFSCVTGYDNVNGICKLSCGANQERVGENCVAACNSQLGQERVGGSCQVVYQFYSLSIGYDSKIKKSGNVNSILEADTKTYLYDAVNGVKIREATYDEVTNSSVSIVMDPSEAIRPVSASLLECSRIASNVCRSRDVDMSKLTWTLEGGNNTSRWQPESNWLCVNTGQSVVEKRALIDCGASGAVLLMISDKIAGPEPRGTILSTNSRGFASGSFTVRASISNSTTGFESYAGRSGSLDIQLENRLDMHLSTNQSIFEGYGVAVLTTELIVAEGFGANATFKTLTCTAITSTGVSIPMTKRQYENQFDFGSPKPATLPTGTTVTISCSGTLYDDQSASATMVRTK